MLSWQETDRSYHRYSHFLKQKFGKKVFGVSIDAGFTCPNIDGTVARGGCVFCNNNSFVPARQLPKDTITTMIDTQVIKMRKRFGAEMFLANFHAATSTYADIEILKSYYAEALNHPEIEGIKISTRPDCLSDEVLDLIASFQKDYYVILEIGLQTIHEKTSKWINRAHSTDCFIDAVKRAHARGISICTHVILGLKDETTQDMIATAKAIGDLGIQGVKIHHLQVVKNTALAYQYKKGQIEMMTREETLEVAADFLEALPPEMVIYRILGETLNAMLIAPDWNQDKHDFAADLELLMSKRQTRQGSRYAPHGAH